MKSRLRSAEEAVWYHSGAREMNVDAENLGNKVSEVMIENMQKYVSFT